MITKKSKPELSKSIESESSSPKEGFPDLEKWWDNLNNFSDDFMKERIQPPLDETVNFDD